MVAARIAALCVALVLGFGCKKKSLLDADSGSRRAPIAAAASAGLPEIKHPVTDLTGKLSAADTESIARELVDHQAATGVQLAVLIVDTTPGYAIDDYAQQVFNAWGGGSAEHNDGALFVLAISDRRNRLHLGYGLEPVIPDASAKRMLDALRPHLRAGDYAAATRELVGGVRARTSHLTPGGPRNLPLGAYPWMWIVMVVLGLLGGIAWAVAFRKGLAAWRKRPKRWDRKSLPQWYVRAGAAILDFFRHPPVALTTAALVGVHFVIRFVFRHGEGYAGIYALLYWLFIPLGWPMGVKKKAVSITTAVFAVGFVVIAISFVGPEMLVDGHMVTQAIFPMMAGLFTAAIVILPIIGGIAGGVSGGGSSYSSSSSRSSSSSSRSSSSSSSSYSSRSYSGGGGRSGGGGASSSW